MFGFANITTKIIFSHILCDYETKGIINCLNNDKISFVSIGMESNVNFFYYNDHFIHEVQQKKDF